MQKLNIFFSNSISTHKWGGGEKWMVTAANGLKSRGHNVTLSGKANSEFLKRAQQAGLKTIPLNIYTMVWIALNAPVNLPRNAQRRPRQRAATSVRCVAPCF